MAFPADPLAIKGELLINGTWTDITTRHRGQDRITVTSGQSGQQGYASADNAQFTLNNRDGVYSNRNPSSSLYGLLGRNIQYRASVTQSEGFVFYGDYSTLGTTSYDGATIATTDKAALDITGDIDIRADIDPDDWQGMMGQPIAAKYVTSGNQRSWLFMIGHGGYLKLIWSPDGSTRPFATSTEPVTTYGRKGVRATLDVNNGSGGYTVTFYTSDDFTNWTTLGTATVTTSGTTSIFASTSQLEVGTLNNASGRRATFVDITPFVGRVYRVQVLNGIAGSNVADMNATGQTEGATSWSDGLGNTWTCTASAAVTKRDTRFWGEVSTFPQRWDSTGRDVYVPMRAASIVQRLSQGQKPLQSPIFRNLKQYTTYGWWTCEDESGSGATANRISAIAGNAGTFTLGSFGQSDDLPGSAGVLTFSDDNGYATGVADTSGANSGVSYYLWYFKLSAIPVSSIGMFDFYNVGGTIARVNFAVTATTYTMTAYDTSGNVAGTSNAGFGTGGEPDVTIAMRFKMTQNGANIDWEWAWYPVGGATTFGVSSSFTAYTAGRPKSWVSTAFTGKSGMQLAHIVLARADIGFSTDAFKQSTNAYNGERAEVRARRLAAEESIPFFWRGAWYASDGSTALTVEMGPQGLKTFLQLLQECADATGGILYTPRDKFGIAVSSHYWLLNRGGPTFTYSSKHLSGSLEPDEDDVNIVNDMTVRRAGGSFGRFEKTSGTMNTNSSTVDTNGVGLYDEDITVNVYSDEYCDERAQWEVALGTWDEARYLQVQIELHRSVFVASTSLTSAVKRLIPGLPYALAGLPAWLPPDTVWLKIKGITEILENRMWTLRFANDPYGPYLNGVYAQSGASLTNMRRAQARATTVSSTVAAGGTTIVFAYSDASDNTWSTAATPYNVKILGEEITVNTMGAVTGAGPYTQTATGCTRNVNNLSGGAKSLTAGSAIVISSPARWSRRG